jgi:hypothetical protein
VCLVGIGMDAVSNAVSLRRWLLLPLMYAGVCDCVRCGWMSGHAVLVCGAPDAQ